MALNLSAYLREKLANGVLRNVAYTFPVKVYLHLYTSDPTVDDVGTEVSGDAYVAQELTFDAAVAGVCTNSAEITFPLALSNWGTITHAGIRDALSGGNLLYHGTIDPTQVINTGQQLKFTLIQAGNT